MAYKFQLGAFTASGSIKVEDSLDAGAGLQISGSAVRTTVAELHTINQVAAGSAGAGKALVLNAAKDIGGINDLSASAFATSEGYFGTDNYNIGNASVPDFITMKPAVVEFKDGALDVDIASHDGSNGLKLGGALVTSTAAELNKLDGAGADVTAAKLTTLSALTDAEIGFVDGASAANSVASKVAVLDGSRKLVGIAELSASADIIGHHGKVRQLSLAYDGAGGSEGHIKLGAGGDMQMAVFSDDAYVINNTADKDIVFQVKKAGGSNVQPLRVDGSEHSVVINKLSLSGTLVTATGAELNIMDGGTSASSVTVADADRLVLNDNGTMKQVAMTDFETYFESALDTLSNVTTVGALNAGSITSGFGSIDNGTSKIQTGGELKLDVDIAAAPAVNQTVSGQAGAITFGAGADAGIGVYDDNLYIESNVDQKGIVFKAHDGAQQAEIVSIDGAGMAIEDDKGIVFGSDDDVSIKYDEATSDSLMIQQNVEGAALAIGYAADQHDDAGDLWAMTIAADGGKKTWANDIASKGSPVEMFSITPHATATESTAAFAGHVTVGHDLTVAGDLTVSGDFVQMDVTKLTVEDPLIELARGQANNVDALDIGFFGKYGDGGTHKYAGLFRDANDSGKFHLFKDLEAEPTTVVNRGGAGYAKATLVVDELDGIATKAKVTDSSANTNFDLVFHDASNGLLEDDGALTYNPSTAKLTAGTFVGNLEGSISEALADTITSDDTLNPADGTLIRVDASSGDVVVTLPAANAAAVAGLVLKIKRIDSSANKVTIHRAGSDTIDGGHSIVLESALAGVMLFSDGSSEYYVM